jgi:predicted DsbA family dithiol-disulfide isomerase
VRWTAYPLRPDTPEEGLALAEVFADSDTDIEEMNVRLKKAAQEAGLPFGRRTMTYNSRLAHELSKWADSRGKGDAFRGAVYRAYFVDGQNIGKLRVLAGLAESTGFSEAEARRVIETGAFKEAVDQDWTRSLQVDPEYIPSLMLDDHLLVNPQDYALFEQFVQDKGVRRREPDLSN